MERSIRLRGAPFIEKFSRGNMSEIFTRLFVWRVHSFGGDIAVYRAIEANIRDISISFSFSAEANIVRECPDFPTKGKRYITDGKGWYTGQANGRPPLPPDGRKGATADGGSAKGKGT